MRALSIVVASIAAVAIAASTGSAVPVRDSARGVVAFGEPAAGKLLLGVVGPKPADFDRLTGKHHALHVIFATFASNVDELISSEYAAGRLPILSLSSSVAPADIASGAEDGRYLTLAATLNASGNNVWVRVLPEMNGAWNAWCAFDLSGRSRGPKYATHQLVRAFRRIALILRGGPIATINAKLRAARLPALRTAGGDIAASGKVAIIWNPQGHGTPFIDANGPAAYWPGPTYVDIVADDMYSDSAEPSWQGMDTLYAYAKPFLVAEWGLKGEDDTVFASRMFTWISSHPRLIGLVYFNKGWSGGSGIYELRSKPRSLAIYRRAIRNPRFLSELP